MSPCCCNWLKKLRIIAVAWILQLRLSFQFCGLPGASHLIRISSWQLDVPARWGRSRWSVFVAVSWSYDRVVRFRSRYLLNTLSSRVSHQEHFVKEDNVSQSRTDWLLMTVYGNCILHCSLFNHKFVTSLLSGIRSVIFWSRWVQTSGWGWGCQVDQNDGTMALGEDWLQVHTDVIDKDEKCGLNWGLSLH